MKRQNINPEDATNLRQNAEEQVKLRRDNARLGSTDKTSEPDLLKLIHELEVHQIELEMQNEELVIAKEKAELAEEKYTELYDFAPSGYVALSKKGEILELNFAAANMLGNERTKLIKKRFEFFVSIDTKKTFNLFLQDIFTSKVKQTCEAIIATEGQLPIYINIDGIVSQNNELCHLTVVDITEHKRALEAIQMMMANQEAIFESSPVAMFILDETTNIIQLNAAAVLMTGNSDGEALQHRPGNALGCIHSKKDPLGCGYAEDCKVCVVRNGVESLIANGGSIHGAELELELIRDETPKKIWVRVGAQPIHINGNLQICVAMDDITEHKLAEEKIKESENNFRSIFESHSASVAIIETDTTISMVNDSYCELSGYTREEVIGTSWTKQIPPDDLERLKEYNRIRMLNPAEAPSTYEFTFYHKNGEIKHAMISVAIISGTKKIIASFIDISQRKQAEESLLAKADELERFFKITVGRETNMVELKKEINNLLNKLGQDNKYTIHE